MSTNEKGTAKVTGFRIPDQTVEIGNAEGLTIKEVAAQMGLDMDGRVWIVNGRRLSGDEVNNTRIKADDNVHTGSKSSQG